MRKISPLSLVRNHGDEGERPTVRELREQVRDVSEAAVVRVEELAQGHEELSFRDAERVVRDLVFGIGPAGTGWR